MDTVSYRQDTRPLVTLRSRPPFAKISTQNMSALLKKKMAKETNNDKMP
jgi:hypothetical protein